MNIVSVFSGEILCHAVCTAYNLVDQSDYFYWITTFISIISSCNGVLKLLKKGPLRLIARNSGFKAQLLLFGSAFFFIVSKGLSIFVLVNSSPTYYVWWFLLILFSEVLLAFILSLVEELQFYSAFKIPLE